MTADNKKFGVRLKELRLSKKLTQQQLGDIVHVSKVSISGYERGERSPDKDTLTALANFFNVSTDYLLGRDTLPQRKLGPRGELLASHIDDDVSDEDMEDILRYIEFRKKNPL